MKDTPKSDSIVESVVQQFHGRAAMGKAKYGTTMDRNDLTPMQWIQHLQEELMDAVVYLEKVKQTGGLLAIGLLMTFSSCSNERPWKVIEVREKGDKCEYVLSRSNGFGPQLKNITDKFGKYQLFQTVKPTGH